MDDLERWGSGVRSLVAEMKYRPTRSSLGLGWPKLLAGEFLDKPDGEIVLPALSHPFLVLCMTPGAEFTLEAERTSTRWRPHPGSISLLPAGLNARWTWRGRPDTLLLLLDEAAISPEDRAGSGLDRARLPDEPVITIQDPQMLSVLTAIRGELRSGGLGGTLCVEALRNLLTIYLLRKFEPVRRPSRGGSSLSPAQLRRVLEYIEDNLGEDLRLDDLAMTAGLSAYHFARLFKATTGATPHGHVIARRVERAKLLLRRSATVAEVAAEVGFCDQSHLTRHFKRLVGVTPGEFR